MTSSAFAPGHVSGLFAVHDEDADVLKRGSRGAGWSVDRGATATVSRAPATSIEISGVPAQGLVTRAALQRLAPGVGLHVTLQLDLPAGQGFGMSAAGTLAACLAACNELDIEPERALEATHAAEVEAGTGLGDAVGSWFGAGEVRMKPGCPPHGWALRIEPPPGARFLFCVMGAAIATPSIIRDATWKARTRALGDAAVDRVLAVGRPMAWDAILRESHEFGRQLGLMPEPMRRLGESLPPNIKWGQSMLGNTLWATGPAPALATARATISARGTCIETGIDLNGARRLRTPAAT